MWQLLVKRWWKYLYILSLKIRYSYETFEKWSFQIFRSIKSRFPLISYISISSHRRLKFSQKASILVTSMEINAWNTGQDYLSKKPLFLFHKENPYMNSGFTSVEGKYVTNTACVDKTERDGVGKAEIPLWLKPELPVRTAYVLCHSCQAFLFLFPTESQNLLILRSAIKASIHWATLWFFQV